ncbi:MAG: tyrosine-type recombinase/integrase [Microlunatus sp.]|nr:tyrosine-type recombinase/integrase [Microlunatus sp.]
MMPRKTPNGRWRAQLKSGRVQVASKTFDTRREAVNWLSRERAALAGGVDPRAGRERVRQAMSRWLESRQVTVSQNTHRMDRDLVRVLPKSLATRELGSVSDREIARCFETWLSGGLSEKSTQRYRASLSVFFGWCVRERLILTNPVLGVRVPKQSTEPVEMQPFTEDELEAAYARWHAKNARLADILLVLGWTGLRWSEVRAVTVRDVMRVPTPGLMIRRAHPEGVGVKSTKGRRSRRVPLADRVLPIVLDLAESQKPNDLLFTTDRGAQLHRTPVLRSVKWASTADGRRIHDLRHTAACLWLARGVDPGTVQAWMGHESIATTNLYLHFLGTSADSAGLQKLNFRPGVRGERAEEV